jgi:NTP pyrophosphatase (non-canonical NTP hydrolase)
MTTAPTPLFITCPRCTMQHVDAGEFATKPHHTHTCQGCGLTWRVAIEPTVGVRFLPGFQDAPADSGTAPASHEPLQAFWGRPEYFPATPAARLSKLMEEAGEVIQCVGKIQQFGLDGYNPELAPEERVLNRDHLLKELGQLEFMLQSVRADLVGREPSSVFVRNPEATKGPL